MVFIDHRTAHIVYTRICEVAKAEKCKYLGEWLNEGTQYLQKHEKYLTTKGNRNLDVLKKRADEILRI